MCPEGAPHSPHGPLDHAYSLAQGPRPLSLTAGFFGHWDPQTSISMLRMRTHARMLRTFRVFVAERCALRCAPITTHWHNPLCVFCVLRGQIFFCVRVFFVAQVRALRCTPVTVAFDLRLRFELRVTQSHQSGLGFALLVVRDLASVTFDHELRQCFVVRNFAGLRTPY